MIGYLCVDPLITSPAITDPRAVGEPDIDEG